MEFPIDIHTGKSGLGNPLLLMSLVLFYRSSERGYIMKRLSMILGAILVVAVSGGASQFVSGSDNPAVALKTADAPDRCSELRTKISQAQQDIQYIRDEILSLQEDILNGKNVEWAREQIKKTKGRDTSARRPDQSLEERNATAGVLESTSKLVSWEVEQPGWVLSLARLVVIPQPQFFKVVTCSRVCYDLV